MYKKLSVLILGAVFSASAMAAKPIKFGTGGSAGNYFSMANDIASYCADGMDSVLDRELQVLNSDGSVANIFGLINKQFSVGWVQEDVLQYYNKQNPTKVNENALRIVAGGHQESVHLLVPKGYKPSKGLLGGMFNFGDGEALDINLLKDQEIGSYGGSLVSAKALSYFLDLNLQVSEIERNTAVNMPILLVGGQPHKPVQDLLETGKYDLVPLDGTAIQQRAPFYSPITVNYEAGGQITSTPSVGVRAYIVAKALRKDSKNENMRRLATCIDQSLEDLADDPDTNPNWSTVVDLEDDGVQTGWRYFRIDEM